MVGRRSFLSVASRQRKNWSSGDVFTARVPHRAWAAPKRLQGCKDRLHVAGSHPLAFLWTLFHCFASTRLSQWGASVSPANQRLLKTNVAHLYKSHKIPKPFAVESTVKGGDSVSLEIRWHAMRWIENHLVKIVSAQPGPAFGAWSQVLDTLLHLLHKTVTSASLPSFTNIWRVKPLSFAPTYAVLEHPNRSNSSSVTRYQVNRGVRSFLRCQALASTNQLANSI